MLAQIPKNLLSLPQKRNSYPKNFIYLPEKIAAFHARRKNLSYFPAKISYISPNQPIFSNENSFL